MYITEDNIFIKLTVNSGLGGKTWGKFRLRVVSY